MDYQSRIRDLQYLSRNELIDLLADSVEVYDRGLYAISSNRTVYDNSLAFTFAVLAVEDGHYYECEHTITSAMMDERLVSTMRRLGNEIVVTDNLMGAIIQLQALFDRMNYSEVSAALDLSVCYFLLTGGMTTSRRRLLSELFGDR